MADQNNKKNLDDLLNSALASYSAVEPRPGLESRILAHLRDAANQPQARFWRLQWLWAAVAIAAIAFAALFLGRHRTFIPTRHDVAQTQQPSKPSLPIQSSAPEKSGRATNQRQELRAIKVARNSNLPFAARPQVFPTPTPLSEQERLLLSYYARTPREELIAQSHPEEPLLTREGESDIAIPDLTFVPQKSSNTR